MQYMFSAFKPKEDLGILFAQGINLDGSGRFKETLAFNHFNKRDKAFLREVHKRLESSSPTMNAIFTKYLDEISPDSINPISQL